MKQGLLNVIRRGLEATGLPRFLGAAHGGASTDDKALLSWNPIKGSADSDLLPDLDTLVARSRDLARNHGVAQGAVQTHLDNIVGTGLRLSSLPDYWMLGRDKAWAEEWSTRVESLWLAWASSNGIDAASSLNFWTMTRLVLRSMLLNGEALGLALWLPGLGRYATRIQLIEPDRLSSPNGRLDYERLRGGIEIDERGAPIAYWIRKTHPGDWYGTMMRFSGNEWERVPAFTPWGRRRIIHVFDRERVGQSRGKPILSAVLAQFRMLDRYQSAELQAAIVNAMIAAFIETPMEQTAIAELFGADPNSKQFKAWLQQRREYVAPLRGGAIIPIYPGDKLQPFTPGRPANAFDSFVTGVFRHIAVGLNLPYELLLKDFSKTNYSSARAALLEAWRFFNSTRQLLGTLWATPVYELWLEEVVQSGLVEAPDFYENREFYQRCKWIGPGRGWIDPVKEAQAAQIRMDAGISTLEDECAEQGKDWEETLEQRASERQRMRELDLLQAAELSSQRPVQASKDQEEVAPA
jgi:lambda family phage portal protein